MEAVLIGQLLFFWVLFICISKICVCVHEAFIFGVYHPTNLPTPQRMGPNTPKVFAFLAALFALNLGAITQFNMGVAAFEV